MKRRDFIRLLGGALAVWLSAALAQHKIATVGFLGTGTVATQNSWFEAFAKRLTELGWVEGRTVAIEIRWAEGRTERYVEIGAEFVRLKVDIMVTTGGAVPALMRATSVIPIVFAIDGDPVGRGLVASLARPGGNVTGLSQLQADLAGKRPELLRELFPTSAGWRCWPMLRSPERCKRPRKSGRRRASFLALRSCRRKSAAPKTSRLPSMR